MQGTYNQGDFMKNICHLFFLLLSFYSLNIFSQDNQVSVIAIQGIIKSCELSSSTDRTELSCLKNGLGALIWKQAAGEEFYQCKAYCSASYPRGGVIKIEGLFSSEDDAYEAMKNECGVFGMLLTYESPRKTISEPNSTIFKKYDGVCKKR